MASALSYKIDEYESLLLTLQNALGVVVPDHLRSNLVDRLEPLLSTYKLDSLHSLAKILQGNQADELKPDVLNAISLCQADWYLSPDIKTVLQGYIFSRLPENARVWFVGCGQGQPAYALAMEVAQYKHNSGDKKNIQIIATDVSHSDISQARLATYSSQQFAELSDEYKNLYTSQNDKTSDRQIKEKVSQLVSFSQCDVTGNFQSLGTMDLIICPEILVYFSYAVKLGILRQFSDQLSSGGIFLSGSNQAVISFSESFERVEHPAGVFYRNKKPGNL